VPFDLNFEVEIRKGLNEANNENSKTIRQRASKKGVVVVDWCHHHYFGGWLHIVD